MLSLYVESQEWQETECCHYMWNHKSGKILNVVIIMWSHKSGKRLNVVITCGITRVARD